MAELTLRERFGLLASGRKAPDYIRNQTVRQWQRKQTQVMRAIIEATPQARWTTMDYTAAAREGYNKNPYVYSAISQVARTFAGIKWKVYSDPTKDTEYEDHPLKKLLDRPNPREGHSVFFENFMAYLLLDGNTFLQMVGPNNKPPTELYCLRPDRMVVLPGTVNSPIGGYVYQVAQIKVPLPEPTVRHLKLFNPLDDWRGLSPIAAAAMSIDQSNASKSWNVALLQNGAAPKGAMSTTGLLDPEQYQRLKENIQEEYSGFANAGRPLLLEGGVTWQEMGLSPNDMSWLEGQKLSAREIAIIFNIAPELLGDASNKTYSNFGEARVALYQENILPRSDWVRDELNAWLSPLYPDEPYCDYDIEDIEALQEDRDKKSTRVVAQFTAGFVKVNEARVECGYPEDDDSEWGDKYVFELPQRSPAQPEIPGLGGLGLGAPTKPGQLAPGEEQGQLPAAGGTTRGAGSQGVGAGTNEPGEQGNAPGPSAPNTPGAAGQTGTGGAGAAKRTVVPFARGRATTKKQYGT